MMSAEQVIETLAALTQVGISAWVDGGWGVDALIGEQTRDHGDLDLVIPIDSLPTCRGLLIDEGFRVERDWLPTALAMRHSDGRGIDLHPVASADDGGGDQIQLDGVRRWHYDPPVTGTIAGEPVWCCSPECQVAAHLGYEPGSKDRADMGLLARRFGLDLPRGAGYEGVDRSSL